ncbi:MAG: hypothetical protein HYR76_05685 [Ignavibacteria bacterium]|nr:hypothetical protein [Ignavibacteria bacterium]
MTVDASGNVTSYDDYCPFGQGMEGRSANIGQGDTRYKFIGKEYDTESGFDWLDARGYDPRIGRFFVCDPLANMPALSSWSPYHYSFCNPMRFKDPSGMMGENGETQEEKRKQEEVYANANINLVQGTQQVEQARTQMGESIVISGSVGLGYRAEIKLGNLTLGGSVGIIGEVSSDVAGNVKSNVSGGAKGELEVTENAKGSASLGGSVSTENGVTAGLSAEGQIGGKGGSASLTPDGIKVTGGKASIDQGFVIGVAGHFETFGGSISVDIPKLASGLKEYTVGAARVTFGAAVSKMMEFRNIFGSK